MADPDEDGDLMIDRAGNSRISNLPGSRTWFTHIPGSRLGQVYYYRIRALNDADGDGRPGEDGEVSDWSGASLTQTMPTLGCITGHPRGARECVREQLVTETGLTHRIVVSWATPEVPADANLSPVTRYEIQWQQNDDVRRRRARLGRRRNPGPDSADKPDL